ncbi:hypothetical protein DEO72_LG3g1855 [Vigna unguiculata]|uniref:Uncharacterized protein n=1 Tax=Vigna unguiculata TaxID=3917 RepID=A0A4D6LFD4_VIGUN|nr:hypothetical protein DEO72_LG3g1855 [Vigna unguiculata]
MEVREGKVKRSSKIKKQVVMHAEVRQPHLATPTSHHDFNNSVVAAHPTPTERRDRHRQPPPEVSLMRIELPESSPLSFLLPTCETGVASSSSSPWSAPNPFTAARPCLLETTVIDSSHRRPSIRLQSSILFFRERKRRHRLYDLPPPCQPLRLGPQAPRKLPPGRRDPNHHHSRPQLVGGFPFYSNVLCCENAGVVASNGG